MAACRYSERAKYGFTLIELSIVLVIIGLLVGGVLVGQDLIKASETRAQISQMQKYQTAVEAFRSKYDFLPGDIPSTIASQYGMTTGIPDPYASQFGFLTRGTNLGQGDGDGIIAGMANTGNLAYGDSQTGEPTMFWVDLSTAKLLDGGFSTATPTASYGGLTMTMATTPNLAQLFPAAKISQGSTFVYVWSGGYSLCANCGSPTGDGQNYFAISGMPNLYGWGYSLIPQLGNGLYTLSVAQAYNIDMKVDDGMPQSGRVVALVPNGVSAQWAGSTGYHPGGPVTTAKTGSTTSCFDNNSAAGTPQQYSMEIDHGNGINCALSFKMQAD